MYFLMPPIAPSLLKTFPAPSLQLGQKAQRVRPGHLGENSSLGGLSLWCGTTWQLRGTIPAPDPNPSADLPGRPAALPWCASPPQPDLLPHLHSLNIGKDRSKLNMASSIISSLQCGDWEGRESSWGKYGLNGPIYHKRLPIFHTPKPDPI